MPPNKNFQRRITILDECFASRTGLFTLERLGDILYERMGFTISRRTIQNDIDYIRGIIEENLSKTSSIDEFTVFVPKLFDGKKTAFRYSDADYALGNQLLSKSDQEQLEETLAILSRYRNRADFDWLDALFPRIETSFNLAHEDYNGLISYQSNRDYVGQPLVGKLYNQLLRKKVLKISYKPFDNLDSYLRIIHPYHLKQYNNRWFLFGLQDDENYKGITNLALDRIQDFTETNENIKKDQIEWGDYFDDMIGVSKNEDDKPIQVKLKFDKKRIKYVLTKPIHGATQKLDVADSDKSTILIEVVPNRELYQTLLSFGKDVRVIEPDLVKEEMRKHAMVLIEYYKI
ncbi:WYL domain-containing protein [Flagellimonas alvinocaridis]|uniref:WYL domain-containing protein n=1 Tax=Flagellimonas alvinocaridis TaxID=2530200 RepID=A0A4V4HXF9_9FLAO|nr:WYL domain-containing protein [Allomuricauda alvinocaridis]THV60826.1 WYL domain-containing protein [Allomuricauda alvinocaridis]